MSECTKKKCSKVLLIVGGVVLLGGCVYFGHLAFSENKQYEEADRVYEEIRDIALEEEPDKEPDEEPDKELPKVMDEKGRPHVDEKLLPEHDLIDDDDSGDYEINEPDDPDDPYLDWYMSMQVHVSDLQAINPDVLCWVYVPNTLINYPVMQEQWDEEHGNTRSDYIYEDIYNSYSVEGSLFVKSHSPSLQADRNGHMTIYGHNMKNQSMFATLIRYKSEDFFKENPYIYLFYPDRTERWVVWTAGHIITTDDNIAPVYTTYLELGSDSYQNCIDFLYNNRYYDTWVTGVDNNTRTLTLSTCDWINYDHSGRMVVTAVKDKTLIWKGVDDSSGTADGETG